MTTSTADVPTASLAARLVIFDGGGAGEDTNDTGGSNSNSNCLLQESSQQQQQPQQQQEQCDETKKDDDNGLYFHGFGRCPRFERWFRRWDILEMWKELVLRPEFCEGCDADDRDLWEEPRLRDDYDAFAERCRYARKLMNDALPATIETIPEWDGRLIPLPSRIPGAGMGLFYIPQHEEDDKDNGNAQRKIIPKGTTICYYTGHIHDDESSRSVDKGYLLHVLDGVVVDPGPLPYIKARYINDPKNPDLVNCEFRAERYRAAIVTTRGVHPGEELFISYGEVYWSQSKIVGTSLFEIPTDNSTTTTSTNDDDDKNNSSNT